MTTRGREAGGDLPYTGTLGLTRVEPAFVTGPDGHARRVEIVRSLNVATDPALARAAIDGSLNVLEDGTELAVPHVYHDPAARRFVLVVPRTRAHEELTLRADLLVRLASDTSAPIPAYVREARAVLGAEGLGRYLDETPDAPEPGRKMGLVSQREDRLRDRAEDITRREDEIRQRNEELDMERSDLGLREQQLEQRFNEVVAREESLAQEERAILANKAALLARERKVESREQSLSGRETALAAREKDSRERRERGSAAATRAVERESSPELGGFDANPATRVGTQAYDVEPIEAEPIDAEDAEPIEAVEAVDDATPLPAVPPGESTEAPEKLTGDEVAAAPAESIEAEELESEDLEPGTPTADVPAAWAARGSGVYAAVVDGEVRMWASGKPETAARLAAGNASLVLQADPDSPLPLAVLTVLDSNDNRFTRAVLDYTRPDDRAVLETLGRDFRLRLEVISNGGRALGSYTVGGPGEVNALKMARVLAAREGGTDEARKLAADKLTADGVSWPQAAEVAAAMFDEESSFATAAGTERSVRAFEPLLDANALERFVLATGTSAKKIDSTCKRAILAALRCGLPLSANMTRRAVELAVAPDNKALATLALNAYARSCDAGPDLIERSRAEAARAWGPLLEWASKLGATPNDTARASMRALFDADDPELPAPPETREAPDPAGVEKMSDADLREWSDHPGVREPIAREMIRRDPVRFSDSLGRAIRLLPPLVAGDLVGEMLSAGDELGDLWVELLGSKRQVVSAMAAAAVAALKLRRGLNPVLQRAVHTDTPDGAIFAWAAGEFGSGVVRSVGRIEGMDPARLALVLAHAIRSGGGRDVEKARTGGVKIVADAASQATGMVDEARAFDASLRKSELSSDAARAVGRILARSTAKPSDGRGAGAAEDSTT